MPKKTTPGRKPAPKWKFLGFINVELNDREREHFRTWTEPRFPDMVASMIELAEVGWKASFGFDSWNDCYTFSITGKKTSTKYDGFCLMVRHRDSDQLLRLADYLCHFIVPDEIYPLPDSDDTLDWS